MLGWLKGEPEMYGGWDGVEYRVGQHKGASILPFLFCISTHWCLSLADTENQVVGSSGRFAPRRCACVCEVSVDDVLR